MRVVLTGGGTGGHVFPALAIAEALRALDASIDIHFLGTANGFEGTAVPQAGERLHVIRSGGIVGKSLFECTRGALSAGWGVFQSLNKLRELRPDIVVGTGGFVMAPVLLAARIMRIPFVIQEQNSFPGLTTRKFARHAKCVCIAYSQASAHLAGANTVVTGNPLRQEILDRVHGAPKRESTSQPRILITGGSLGARSINNAVAAVVSEMCGLARVTWQYGKTGIPEAVDKSLMSKLTNSGVLNAVSFLHDMPLQYGSSDLVVCRAGAMTLSEIAMCGLPAVLIPFPHAAHDHQTTNAKAFEENGAAMVIKDLDLSGELLLSKCTDVLSDRSAYATMSDAMHKLARPQAAHNIAEIVQNSTH